jgi:hypothetical protein
MGSLIVGTFASFDLSFEKLWDFNVWVKLGAGASVSSLLTAGSLGVGVGIFSVESTFPEFAAGNDTKSPEGDDRVRISSSDE